MNNKTLYVKTFITPSQSDIKVPKMVTVISKTDSVEVRNYEAAALDKFVLFPLKEGNYTIDMKGNGLESKKIDLVVPIIPSTDTLIIKVSLNPGESISDTTNIWKTEQQ